MNIGGIQFGELLTKNSNSPYDMILSDDNVKNGAFIDNVLDVIKNGSADEANIWLNISFDPEFSHFSYEQRYNLAVNNYFANIIKANNGNIDVDFFWKNFERSARWDNLKEKTEILVEQMNEENKFNTVVSDQEYKRALRKIWTYKNDKGNEECYLDKLGVDEPDFSQCVASADKLKLKDQVVFKDYGREYSSQHIAENNDKPKKSKKYKIGDEYRVEVDEVEPMSKPRYDLEIGNRRSEVLYTNEIIDTRSNFLAKERQNRVEMEKTYAKLKQHSGGKENSEKRQVTPVSQNNFNKDLGR